MIEETALVARVELNKVWVEVDRRSACASCSNSDGCGQKRINDWFSSKTVQVEVLNPLNLIVSPGQSVTVGIEEGAIVKASLALYLLPLLFMIAFAITASIFNFSEIFQILSAILGFVIGLIVTRQISLQRVTDERYQPQLLR